MKKIGYFTQEDAIRLLKLLHKEGLNVKTGFDEKISKRYKKTFSIDPRLKRRSTYKVPKMGWYFLYAEEDHQQVNRVLSASPFAFYASGNDTVAPEIQSDQRGSAQCGNSAERIWQIAAVIAFLLAIAYWIKH